jgi:uncharacterized RDD family membrane protein YckC
MSNIVTAEAVAPAPAEARDLGHDAWARLLARNVDTLILVMPLTFAFGVAIGLVGLVDPPLVQAVSGNGIVSWVFNYLVAVVAAFVVETWLISAFGGTPGKALMGVSVAREAGGKPSVLTAAKRYFLVFAMGRGLSLPLISLMTLINSYNHFTEDGVTTWDDMLELKVERRKVGAWRWAVAIAATVGVAVLSAGLGLMQRLGEGG